MVLDGNSGGVPDEPVPVAEVFECGLDGLGVPPPVEGLEPFSKFTQLSRLFLGLCRGFRSDVAAAPCHPVQGGLRAASSDSEVHCAVAVEHEVGYRERLSGDEGFACTCVRGAVGCQVDGVDRAEGPVEYVEGILVAFREISAGAELCPSWATRADVDRRRQAVRVVGRPFAGAGAPAVFATADDMVDAGRAVPRRAVVPLHVGIKGEEFVVGV